ncbi:MAG: TonB-dependent receptor [Draconibacterium sp.]
MKILSLVLSVFLAANAFAQKNVVTGSVKDGITNEPLEYANIGIYNVVDSALVSGGITNENGIYKIENLKQGDYFLRAHFLGYETTQTSSFVIDAGATKEMQVIHLQPAKQLVEEVNVTGTRINAINKLDKQTYHAEQFESAKGGTAIDVLRNMPSVAVDGEGVITVRGSSGFLLLINGKPVLTDANTALSQLPANVVEHVELITSPSAKYDPDGKAGIVNITTKSGATNGTSVIVNTSYGLPSTTDFDNERVSQRYGGDITFNYQKNKWDISIGGNYTRNDLNGYRVGDVHIENVENNTINYMPSEGERSFYRYNYALRASVQFKADENNIFNLGIFSGKKYQERDANLFYKNYQTTLDTGEKIYDAPYYNANEQIKQGTFTLGDFSYTRKFDNNSSLAASVLYEYDDLYGTTHNHNLTEPGGEMLQYVQNPYKKPIDGYRLKLDYTIELGNGKLESGYQFRSDSQDGVFDYIVTPEDLNQPDLDMFRGTALSINQINSVYSQYSSTGEKLEYNVGLRYEYSKRTVELSFDPETHLLELSNLFPSASILYSMEKGLKLKAGFSRRIQRASNNQLNPIPEREHSETLEIGDPDLRPEFVSLAELGLIKKFNDKNSAFITAYLQASKDPMQRVNSIYNDSILYRVYTNVEKGRSVGFELGTDLNPTEWWALFLGGNIYNQSYHGNLEILGDPALYVDNSQWVYSLNVNTTFDLTSTMSLQANVNYLSGRPTAQGVDSRYLIPNLSLKKTFMDKRLVAVIQWQNIDLGMQQSHRQRITTWGDHFYTTTNYIYEPDFVMLNLSYNFNWKNNKKLPSSEFGEKEF